MPEVKPKPFTLNQQETRAIQQKLEAIGTIASKAGSNKLTKEQEKQVKDAFDVVSTTFAKESGNANNGILPKDLERERSEFYEASQFGTGKDILTAMGELVDTAQKHGLKLEDIKPGAGASKGDSSAKAIIAGYDAFVKKFNPGKMSKEEVHKEIDNLRGLVDKSNFLPGDKRRITDALSRAKDLALVPNTECDWQIAWGDFRQGVNDAMLRVGSPQPPSPKKD